MASSMTTNRQPPALSVDICNAFLAMLVNLIREPSIYFARPLYPGVSI